MTNRLIKSSLQLDATLLANNSQHFWILHVASVCTPFGVTFVACCWESLRKVFETGLTFEPSNISFVPWFAEASATVLDPFAHILQHCWGHVRAKMAVEFKFSLSHVERDAATPRHCWELLANNVACFSTGLYGLYLSHDALQSQHCWELLHQFAHHFQHGRNN